MSVRDYPRMEMAAFGQELLDTCDLDPLYNTLWRAELGPDHIRRWLLAYWCCYSAGEASWICEQKSFWNAMSLMAWNTTASPAGGRWPRGRERRHFRGMAAVRAVEYLAGRYPNPEDACWSLEQPGPFSAVKVRVMEWPLFGPWIAFKIGDMLERVRCVQVDFTGGDVFFFDSPRKAAEEWYMRDRGISPPSTQVAITAACIYLAGTLGAQLAPPRFERRLNLQEYETVLCKWGAHLTGHYPLGIDTRELREALHPWAMVSPTAERLLRCVP